MLSRLPTARPTLGQDEAESRFDLADIINFCWREWKFIAAVFTTVLVIGYVYTLRQTPLYTATAQVLLEPRKDKVPGADAVFNDSLLDYAMVEAQMAILRSTVFLRRVVEKEHLISDPEFGSGRDKAIPVDATGQIGVQGDQPAAIASSVAALQGAISVKGG